MMIGLRTALAVIATAFPAPALPMGPDQLIHDFAACAGRYSAQTEFLWISDGAASDETARRRDAFADLVAALAPDSAMTPAAIMGTRVAAKAEQRRMLELGRFGGLPGARLAADRSLALCARLLPAS